MAVSTTFRSLESVSSASGPLRRSCPRFLARYARRSRQSVRWRCTVRVFVRRHYSRPPT